MMVEIETEAQRKGGSAERTAGEPGRDSPCSPNCWPMALCQASQCKELIFFFCFNNFEMTYHGDLPLKEVLLGYPLLEPELGEEGKTGGANHKLSKNVN